MSSSMTPQTGVMIMLAILVGIVMILTFMPEIQSAWHFIRSFDIADQTKIEEGTETPPPTCFDDPKWGIKAPGEESEEDAN